MTFDANALFRRCRDVRFRNLAGEGLVVRQAASEVLVLNEVGIRVLELLDAGIPLAQVRTALCAEFAVDEDTAATDVRRYVTELIEAGVIEPATR
jgi:hypothetical protein